MNLKTKLIRNAQDKRRLKFLGYTGAAVDVKDYGFDAPVIYDLKALKILNQTLPVKFNHKTDVGVTEKIEKHPQKGIRGEGLFSDSPVALKIQNNADNGREYQASMGLDVRSATITKYTNGVTVNGRFFAGKHYVIRNAIMDEMTITRSGRDSNTEVHVLSRVELSNIKEAEVPKKPARTPSKDPVKIPQVIKKPIRKAARIPNRDASLSRERKSATQGELLRMMNQYPDYTEIIAEGADAGWSFKRLDNALKFKAMEDKLPPVPNLQDEDGPDELEARLVHTLSKNPEKILEKKYGEEVRDRVMEMNPMGIKEMLVIGAHRLGRQFSGHSDIDSLIEFMGNANRQRMNLGFSSFNMPSLFKRVSEIIVESSWKIEGMFAASMCTPLSKSNFNPSERYRPRGGEIWEGLDANGRIKHTAFGKTDRFITTLDTKAQMVMFNRETIENDDFGVISDLIDLFQEGSEIVPDDKLMKRLYQADGTFFVGSGATQNSFQLALNATNLKTVFESVQNLTINKGRVDWNQKISDNWYLVIPNNLTMEQKAFEILQQSQLISDTSITGPVGAKNFWFGRLEVKTFNQLGNVTMHADTSDDDWFIWPKTPKNAPFSINYLKGRKRPVIKTVDAPVDMLGFGVVGYFDVEINDRERRAVARSIPTVTTS